MARSSGAGYAIAPSVASQVPSHNKYKHICYLLYEWHPWSTPGSHSLSNSKSRHSPSPLALARGSESPIDLSMSTRAPDSGSILPDARFRTRKKACLRITASGVHVLFHGDTAKHEAMLRNTRGAHSLVQMIAHTNRSIRHNSMFRSCTPDRSQPSPPSTHNLEGGQG